MTDEMIEQVAQVVHVAIAHRWMTVFSALREDHDYPELLRDIARALADAGMLARPLPTRDEIVDVLSGWPIGTGYYQTQVAIDEAQDMADAVLALLKGHEA